MSVQALGVRIAADTSDFVSGMEAVAGSAQKAMQAVVGAEKMATAAMRDAARQAESAANGGSYKKIAADADKVAHSSAGVNRELLVLAHELSQGNYSKFGGSMLVLAERTNALEYAMTATGAAALGLVAGGVAFIAMAAAGAIEADKFAKSLQLTGNFAAITQDSLDSMAKAQAAGTGQSVKSARQSLEAAAGSGLFGPQAVAQVARAMSDYERLTGASADDALKNFDRIKDGVAKWAEEQNKQIHFLSLGQYEQIKAMEQAGDTETAAVQTLTLLSQTLESRGTPSVGNFAAAWHVLRDGVLDAIEAMDKAGKPSTVGDHVNDLQRRILFDQNGNAGGSYADRQRDQAAAQIELSELLKQQFRDTERLADASTRAAQAQSQIASKDYLDKLHDELATRSRLTEKLEEYKRHADDLNLSPAQRASDVEALTKKYTPHVDAGASNEYASLVAGIKAFNAQTDEEASRVGKLTEAQTYSLHAHEELDKSGRKLTATQRASISASIDEAAARREVTLATIEGQKSAVARIALDTANAQAQQALVDGVVGAGNDQANAVLQQMQTIGKSTDEIAKFQALSQFDNLVGKALLGADDDTVRRINDVAAVLRGNLATAIDSATAAQTAYNASFSNGWDKAMSDYVKNAQDSAAAGAQVFNDAMSGMTDAIVQFAQTGKLSFSGLVQAISADLVRLSLERGFASLFGGGGFMGLVGTAIGAFGGGTGATAAAASALPGDSLDNFIALGGTGHANGLDYVPYDGYRAVLHEGERVVPRQDVMRNTSGEATHIDFSGASYSFAAGVSAPEVAQQVQTGNTQLEARLRRLISTGKI